MSDQRVTCETAEIAKAKGFDVQTYAHCWVKTLDGDVIHNSERRDIPEHDRAKTYLLQPTQTGLTKWLREVHRIELIPTHYTADYYTYKIYRRDEIIHILLLGGVNDLFEEFEDAWEKGLQKALNLIEI